MKAYDPFIYGRSENRKLSDRARHDSTIQVIYKYIQEQNAFIDQYRDPSNPNYIKIPGFLRVGFHIHFPEKRGWHSRKLRAFNPDKLDDLARSACREGFDIIAVSNKYDDQVFGHEPGIEFSFKEGSIIVLKAQETGHVMPFGYRGRIRQGSLDEVVKSTLEQGGLYVLCHPSNQAHHGAGEAIVEHYRDSAILETLSPLINHHLLNFSFADVIAKEWSLKYSIPGVSVLDARRYLFGGFFVPESIEGVDFSSAETAMEAFALLFKLRRVELARTLALKSDYIINTEAYPRNMGHMLEEATTNSVTSIRSKAIRTFFNALHLKDKNIGLRNFDYQGQETKVVDGSKQSHHIYLLKGNNEAATFASRNSAEQAPNLVFFRKGEKLHIGTTFTDFREYGENSGLEFASRAFNSLQYSFLEEILKDAEFREFRLGLHPTYPVARITPNGQKYMFVAKEFLSRYTKSDIAVRTLHRIMNKFVYRGEEGLRMAALQATLQNEGLNIIPPLYVESSNGRCRIISPFVIIQSASGDYSNLPERERRSVLYEVADQFAWIKSKGIFLTDMHPGNVAMEVGNWFGHYEGGPIIPDITLAGTSVTTFGDSSYNVINPLALPFGPRAIFAWKARRRQHRLIQGFGDFLYFLKSYKQKLEQYRRN